MTRSEIIRRSAEMRLDRVLEEMGIGVREEDSFLRYADPGPPQDVPLPGWKRSRWAKRLLRK